MNKNISEEELLLRKRARRRLVGAIVLVLTAVIVLPAIFDEPKGEREKQEIAINLGQAGNQPWGEFGIREFSGRFGQVDRPVAVAVVGEPLRNAGCGFVPGEVLQTGDQARRMDVGAHIE